MFILLLPMGLGILTGVFGLCQIMRAVSVQRMAGRFHKKMKKMMKVEEKSDEEALEFMPIMFWVKQGLAIGMAVGVFMDVIAYAVAEPLVKISQRAGGAAGILACQNGSASLQVAFSLWGHGSLTAGIVAFVGLAVGTAMAVCGVIVKSKVSANMNRAYANLY